MDYLKNIKPNMKLPKLQKVRESGNAFLSRLSSNIFGTTQKRYSQPGRVTIQSSHISTISSLVDKTKTGTFTYDTKKENYGLYALKCNRNAIKQGLLMNVNPETNFHSRGPKTPSSTDVNHEVFSPCDNKNDIENNFNSMEYQEYYKIEFSEERCLETSVIERNSNISNNNTTRIECNGNSNTSERIPPPRPKRKLSSHTNSTSTSTVNDNNRKCATSTKPILNNERLLKNYQKNHLSSACSIEPELSSSNHSRKLSYGENELSTRNADSSKKNDSALYRIVQAESIINNSDRNQVLCHAGQINSKMIAIDQYSSIDSGKSYLV